MKARGFMERKRKLVFFGLVLALAGLSPLAACMSPAAPAAPAPAAPTPAAPEPAAPAAVADPALRPLTCFKVYDAPKDVTIQEQIEQGRVVIEQWELPEPATKPWKIGILFPLMNAYWLINNYGAFLEADRLGVHTLLLSAGGYVNLERMLAQMEDMVTTGVDIILINPISYEGNNDLTNWAVEQGVPVICVVNDMNASGLLSRVQVSYWEMGYQAGQGMIQDMKDNGMKMATYATTPGPPGAGWSIAWEDGFNTAANDYMAERSDIVIEHFVTRWGDNEKAAQLILVEDILTTYGDTLNYIAGCAPAASAAVYTARASGLEGKLKIIGGFPDSLVIDHVKKGEIICVPTDQAVDQQRLAMGLAVMYLEGRIALEDIPVAMGPVVKRLTPVNIVDFDLASTLEPEGYEAIFEYIPGETVFKKFGTH